MNFEDNLLNKVKIIKIYLYLRSKYNKKLYLRLNGITYIKNIPESKEIITSVL